MDEKPEDFAACVGWARRRFQQCFHNSIAQLLHNFPVAQVTAAGHPFWSGSKRAPTPLQFDPADPVHLGYIKAAANLRATNYGLEAPCWDDDASILAALQQVHVPAFAPRDGVKIQTPEEAEAEAKAKAAGEAPPDAAAAAAQAGSNLDHVMDVDAQCEALVASLPLTLSSLSPPHFAAHVVCQSVEFDKDTDEHMEFVTACSNLRARNYKIPEADMHRSRLIAGKIIPAIATATALVTGLVCLELYKVVQGKPLACLKSGFVNLAIPVFAFSEPQPPAGTVAKVTRKGDSSSSSSGVGSKEDWTWTAWDKLDVSGDLTLQELLGFFEDEYGLEVSMLSYGVSILYSFFQNKKKTKERLPMRMTQLVEAVTGSAVHEGQKYVIFEVMCTDEEGEDVDLPCIRMLLGE